MMPRISAATINLSSLLPNYIIFKYYNILRHHSNMEWCLVVIRPDGAVHELHMWSILCRGSDFPFCRLWDYSGLHVLSLWPCFHAMLQKRSGLPMLCRPGFHQILRCFP